MAVCRLLGLGSVLFGLTIGSAPPALAADVPTRSVSNCATEHQVILGLDSPREDLLNETVVVHILLDGDCGGDSVPFTLGIDGVGYEVRGGRLRPDLKNRGCSQPCWPQQGVGAHLGDYHHKVRLPPGWHHLEVMPGYQGTNLPSFEPISLRFLVGGSPLPFTGISILQFGAFAMLLTALGARLLRRTSRASDQTG